MCARYHRTRGNTPYTYHNSVVLLPESMLEGYSCGDAKFQALIQQSDALTKLQEELSHSLPDNINQHIISIAQGNKLKEIIAQLKEQNTTLSAIYHDKTELLKLVINYSIFQKVEDLSLEYLQRTVNLGLDKMKVLTSDDARECYKTGLVKFADLQDLEPDKIEALTSDDARECYKTIRVKLRIFQ